MMNFKWNSWRQYDGGFRLLVTVFGSFSLQFGLVWFPSFAYIDIWKQFHLFRSCIWMYLLSLSIHVYSEFDSHGRKNWYGRFSRKPIHFICNQNIHSKGKKKIETLKTNQKFTTSLDNNNNKKELRRYAYIKFGTYWVFILFIQCYAGVLAVGFVCIIFCVCLFFRFFSNFR